LLTALSSVSRLLHATLLTAGLLRTEMRTRDRRRSRCTLLTAGRTDMSGHAHRHTFSAAKLRRRQFGSDTLHSGGDTLGNSLIDLLG
jgi:hypothetical protein